MFPSDQFKLVPKHDKSGGQICLFLMDKCNYIETTFYSSLHNAIMQYLHLADRINLYRIKLFRI